MGSQFMRPSSAPATSPASLFPHAPLKASCRSPQLEPNLPQTCSRETSEGFLIYSTHIPTMPASLVHLSLMSLSLYLVICEMEWHLTLPEGPREAFNAFLCEEVLGEPGCIQ